MASVERDSQGYRCRFIDHNGTRRGIRLPGLSKAAAQQVATRIQELVTVKLNGLGMDRSTADWLGRIGRPLREKLAEAGLIEQMRSFTVPEWVRHYIENRQDLKDRTRVILRQAEGSLIQRFGNVPLASVTESQAVAFKAWMRSPAGGGLAENTARRRCGHARQFFAAAMREGLIDRNPFTAVAVTVGAAESKHRFVTVDECRLILNACPCADWRSIFALARWGGLRFPSEVLKLKWGDIDWQEGRISVPEPKVEHHPGRGRRIVPLFPELREVLAESFELAPEGSEWVVNRYRDRGANARTTFGKILDRAKVPRFERPFCNLRSSRVTELRQRFDPKVVAVWLGHSEAISTRHYTQVRPEDYAAAVASAPELSQAFCQGHSQGHSQGHKVTEMNRNEGKQKKLNPEKTSVFPGSAFPFGSLRVLEMLRQGFEP